MEPFQLDQESGLFWIESWIREFPGLNIGLTSRHLGKDHVDGNLALHIEDNLDHVLANRLYLSIKNNVTLDAMTCAEQTHGNHVVEITKENRGAGAMELESSISATDGLVTRLSDTMLTLFYADCVPLFFVDPIEKAVGIAHAGWRGTVQNISGEMVQKFQKTFASNTDNIRVVIGPSIGACCYQVDQKVMNEVEERMPHKMHLVATPDGDEHYRLDLKKMNRLLLEEAGIMSTHIEVSHLCTSCNLEHFFHIVKNKVKQGEWLPLLFGKGHGIEYST